MKPTVISAGIVPVFFRGEKPYFLLLRAYNYWDFPKGMVEHSESILDGAIRELKEETGLTEPDFRWGKDFYTTEAYSNGKVAKYFVACVATDDVAITKNAKTGIVEHHEYRWCAFDEARELVGPRVVKVIEWAGARVGLRGDP